MCVALPTAFALAGTVAVAAAADATVVVVVSRLCHSTVFDSLALHCCW